MRTIGPILILALSIDLWSSRGSYVVAAESAQPAIFGLSIGYNYTDNPAQENLQYADDDAVRNFLLLRALGAEAVLLTRLDQASKELYPGLETTDPTYQAVLAAMSALNNRIDAARKLGRRTTLYVSYSGHGDVERGEGYVQLHNGRLARPDLLKLLRDSRAHANHLIIDACKSYFVVFPRGPGGRRRATRGPFLSQEAAVPPNTGLFLSTSAAQDSHEWEAFQSGVFSHEVRSALRGAADLNQDGLITYEEAAAFIYGANRMVPNQRFRPSFFSRPQSAERADRAVLIDLRRVQGRRIRFGSSLGRHYYVEDEKGVRLADLHPGTRTVTILVPPRGKLFVREARSRQEYAVLSDGFVTVPLDQLPARRILQMARGAEHESFRKLFAEPFDELCLRAYRQRPADLVPEEPRRPVNWLRPGLGIFSLAALATGGAFTGLAARERAKVDDTTPNRSRQEVNQVIRRNNTIAITFYAVSAVAAAGYLAWTFWPSRPTKVKLITGITWTGGEVVLGGSF